MRTLPRAPLAPICRPAMLASLWLAAGAWGALAASAEGQTPAGGQIFQRLCASCHGPSGEGTKDEFPEPLAGKMPLDELARYIDKMMPKKAPQECVGEESRAVAAYIYDAFYSPIAQARNRPARVELSRLTVAQYRNSVADLVGAFRPAAGVDERRGLRGEYFKNRRLRDNDRTLDRVDPVVDFRFGDKSPPDSKLDDAEFAMRWTGSIFIPQSGEYELTLRTENGARMWVNGGDQALIDRWVRSGSDTDHRGSIRLLGGRSYPVRLEFFKFKENSASIALLWKPPHRQIELVPETHLSPARVPPTFVAATPFPPDDRSMGWERGTAISPEWDEATTQAALELVDYVARHAGELAGVSGSSPDRAARLRDFCGRFAERAFRRPLAADERQRYVDRPFETAPDAGAGLTRSVLLIAKSPRFLYRELAAGSGQGDAYDIAARLSFGLWDSLPDAPLLAAAARGELADRQTVAAHAERMAADPRAGAKLRQFLLHWLHVDHIHDLAKDAQAHSDFDEAIQSDLRKSLDLFLDEVVADDKADFRRLLLDDTVPLNGRLARYFGIDMPDDAPFEKVALDPGRRAGLLTHPYLMAGFAYTAESSPIHRGVFVARNLLGRTLRPPPDAFVPLPAKLHPDLTTRQRVALQTKSENCQSCHGMINPLGFALEHFDAVGRLREEELGRPIDAAGSYRDRTGREVRFEGARDLAQFLAASDEAHEAFVEALFHHLAQQPVRAYGPNTLEELRERFAKADFHIRRLMVEIMTVAALPPASAGP
jgi:mono/diheme cytochrome c family protein